MTELVRTLLVDDEEGIRFFLNKILGQAGHVVATAASGEEALEHLRERGYDLVILDLRLGGRVDGLRVLEAVKWRWPGTAVIILTAYASLDSALKAIREGVDGYLLKPIEPETLEQVVAEVLARRRSLAARQPASQALTIDRELRQALLDGQPLDLTPGEFRLLACLVDQAPRVLSPPELVQAVLGYACDDLQEAREIVKWYVYELRRKIEPDPRHPRYVVNVRGVGYRLG